MNIQVLFCLCIIASAIPVHVLGFYIDSTTLGSIAGPFLMGLGGLSTYGTGKLLAFLTGKPRTTKVIHVTPTQTAHGVVNQVHVTQSKPYHWDYLTAPLPHKPLFPQHLQHPVYGPDPIPVVRTKAHLPLAPPYLPLPLLYSGDHKFSSPYW